MRTRIGMIGLGDIAQKAYLPILASHPKVDIVGIASRSEETVSRVGEQYRIAGRFTSVEELLRAEPEAVFIHSPTETHHELVMTCLREGVHVYVDKPLSYVIGKSEQMAAYAKEQSRLLAVGFNRRFAPLYVKSKAWLEEAGGFDLCVAQKHRTGLQQMTSKFTLYDDLIHMLDLLLWIGGEDYSVTDYREHTDDQGRLCFGTGSLAFTQDRSGHSLRSKRVPTVGQFSMVRTAGVDSEKLELHGGGRSVEVTSMETATWYEKGAQPRMHTFGSWETVLYRRGFVGVVEHFLESLEKPEACTIRADQVLAVHRLVEKLV
ncbi:Gfo/Idh/MocA family oxidoreductase [Paenibacillus sp. GD4]|uniref:Gfo/Idh/MocA family protein n=1 Tax=Paenibacillus sp. GD4 TaxID=3068890 RepID=UPI002796B17E|nr:Gfo/Idh/MocA family oxidoreductase [Paenibacillus sp. GD4]MDQ1911722.1 Gfo/Idh/MocA family oxidoreductase [Paenibacillus sp. GD4]